MQFPTPVLPDKNDVDSIRKALLDLLAKLNQIAAPITLPQNFKGTTAVTGTAAQLLTLNPILAVGQIGYETDTKYFKIGDGTTVYNSLGYQARRSVDVAPFPQAGSGVGWWALDLGSSGNPLVLGAGGTWAWVLFLYASATNAMYGNPGGTWVGVSAGGSTIYAGSAGNVPWAFVWRIA